MRILILDDDQVRHEAFARIYSQHERVHVTRYSEAVFALENDVFDLVHLDHDLEGDPDADTFRDGWGQLQHYNGAHVARLICSLPNGCKPKRAIVHSINNSSTAAPAMTSDLNKAGIPTVWEPFGEIA